MSNEDSRAEALDSINRKLGGFQGALTRLAGLPALFAQSQQMREMAQLCLGEIQSHLDSHHEDEERNLFPAVAVHARTAVEGEYLNSLIAQLTAEHRNIERMWQTLAPTVGAIADVKLPELDFEMFNRMLLDYSRHMAVEERVFLPLARTLLSPPSTDPICVLDR